MKDVIALVFGLACASLLTKLISRVPSESVIFLICFSITAGMYRAFTWIGESEDMPNYPR